MKLSEEQLEALFLEQEKCMDAKAAELLNHDPELLDLYQRSKRWKADAKELQRQLIVLIEAKQLAIHVQQWVSSHKNVANRLKDCFPHDVIHDGVASDCAEAIELAAENLKLLAANIRKQVANLPVLTAKDEAQWNKVEEAGRKATMESYREILVPSLATDEPESL